MKTNILDAKRNEITDAIEKNARDIEHMQFSIAEAEKELAKLEQDILLMQSQTGDVAAEAYLQGKPKMLADYQTKTDKMLARKDALELARGTLNLRLGVLGQVRGQLNRKEAGFGKFEALLAETLAAIDEFRVVRAELDAIPAGTPEGRRMILREHDQTRNSWARVPTLVKQLGTMAVELDLYQPIRDILSEAEVELHPEKISVTNERVWWVQTGSKARSA